METPAQKKDAEAIEKFRAKIADIYDELDDFHQHDSSLLRFLKARDMNLSKAEEMLRNNVKWRRENKMDEVMQREHSEDMARRFPFKLSGYDSTGSYVVCMPVGKFDYRLVVDNGEQEVLTKYFMKVSELTYELFKYKSTKGNFVNSAIGIMDYDNFNGWRILSSAATIKFIQDVMQLMTNNYPEVMKSAWVVNAPKIFELIFALMKPFMSKEMLTKIHVYSSISPAFKEAILAVVPPDELPSKYGGSNTSCRDYQFEFGLDLTPNLPEFPLEEMKTESIAPGEKFLLDTEVTTVGTELKWNFKVDDFDIGFSLELHEDGAKEPEELIENVKCDAHLHVQKGRFLCTKVGKYVLAFDNSYSKMRAKTLHYVCTATTAEVKTDA